MLCLRQFLYLATVCACAAVWLCAPAVALAHDKWLEVEPGVSLQPAPAKIYLATGEALRQAELLPERRASRVLKFELRAAASVQDLAGSFREDAQPIAAVPALPAGSSVLRLDTAPIDIELSAEKVWCLSARRKADRCPGRAQAPRRRRRAGPRALLAQPQSADSGRRQAGCGGHPSHRTRAGACAHDASASAA